MFKKYVLQPTRSVSSQHNRRRFSLVRLVPLLLVLAITLFPFGWLGEHWFSFGQILDTWFSTAFAHAIGHILCFGLLGLVLLWVAPGLRTRFPLYIGLMLLASFGQEIMQLLYKQRSLVFDDFRDLAIDVAAFLTVFAIVRIVGHRRPASQA